MNLFEEFNLFEYSKRIKRPMILDGAMGSLLEAKGLTLKDGSWSAKVNFSNPELIIKIHEDYIDSGSDIITTNTFRTNPLAMMQAGISDYKKYVKQALYLAKTAIKNKSQPILLAGSNPPAEDSYQRNRKVTQKELELNHCKHIETLYEFGSNFILNETQSHFDEIKIICNFCSNNKIPFVISLFFDESLKILSGENIEDIIKYIKEFKPLSIGFNCIPNLLINKLLNSISLDYLWGFYINIFFDNLKGKYSNLVLDKLKLNPSFIGGCCGTKPEDIQSLKELLDARISY